MHIVILPCTVVPMRLQKPKRSLQPKLRVQPYQRRSLLPNHERLRANRFGSIHSLIYAIMTFSGLSSVRSPNTQFSLIDRSLVLHTDTYRRTFLAFLCSSYPSIAQAVFSFFSCIESNNERF